MAKPKRERETNNPIGQKINVVLAEKGMAGDYAALAKEFDVAVTSVYGWVEKGRIRKDRLPKLANWSNKSLKWWLETTEDPLITESREIDRVENLRQFLEQHEVDSADEEASHLLAKMLDQSFDYCEALLNGQIALDVALARQIEKKLGLPTGELDKPLPPFDEDELFGTEQANQSLVNNLQDWRLQASSKSQEVIDQLTLLAKKNMLGDADWLLIEQITHRFVKK